MLILHTEDRDKNKKKSCIFILQTRRDLLLVCNDNNKIKILIILYGVRKNGKKATGGSSEC